MPHLADEASMMLNNLIHCLQHTVWYAVESYSYPEVVVPTISHAWDEENHRVICSIDQSMDAEDEVDLLDLVNAATYSML